MIEVKKKKKYQAPIIEQINLDNEISLALASNPAGGPGEEGYNMKSNPDSFNNDPFKNQMA